MKINEKIVQRREEMGLSEKEVADKTGLGIYHYGDVEAYEHEVMQSLDLYEFKLVCQVLDLEPLDLLEGSKEKLDEILDSEPRNVLINRKRIELGLSEEELGERVGFYGDAIHEMERDAEYLESWCLEDIIVLANVLDIPKRVLLNLNQVSD
jgi:transcriptional regulator with XRE-family HTH domain